MAWHVILAEKADGTADNFFAEQMLPGKWIYIQVPVESKAQYRQIEDLLTDENLSEFTIKLDDATQTYEYVNGTLEKSSFTRVGDGSGYHLYGDFWLKAESAPDLVEQIVNIVSQGVGPVV